MDKAEYGFCGTERHTPKAHLRMDTCIAFILDPNPIPEYPEEVSTAL